jgi:hypothetical protein
MTGIFTNVRALSAAINQASREPAKAELIIHGLGPCTKRGTSFKTFNPDGLLHLRPFRMRAIKESIKSRNIFVAMP